MKRKILLSSIANSTASRFSFAAKAVAATLTLGISAGSLFADSYFTEGNLVVLRSTYQDTGEIATVVPGSTVLPNSANPVATGDGNFSNVLLNSSVDGNFGVTSPIFLDQITTGGSLVNTLNVTAAAASQGVNLTTSFTSRSEGSINLSQDGTSLSFLGYAAPVGAIDRSNASTPGLNAANGDIATPTYREVGQITASGGVIANTTTNAFSGDNGRAAILANNGFIYGIGNTGASGTTGANAAVLNTGVQLFTPGQTATSGALGTVSLGSYNVTQNGITADKLAKDNNFRGETIYNNTLYIAKGSGSNGVNTVYRVGTPGSLPTAAGSATISILPGFNTTSEKADEAISGNVNLLHPFGLYFANASTLYVSDEGNNLVADETNPNTNNPNAGLQKWVNSAPDGSGTWSLEYTLRLGLNLGTPYSTPGYSTGSTAVTNVATDGLRQITGTVNGDGTTTIYAVTATVSSAGDAGADPNKLVAITDTLADTTLSQASGEQFTTLDSAVTGDVIRGVSFTPTPEPTSAVLLVSAGGMALGFIRRRKVQA
ncbi:MAG: hypothetical protein P4L99_19125 [Chthoniobacter sp.]|nr:hypothetical protein [Chthoniobacter sp.]